MQALQADMVWSSFALKYLNPRIFMKVGEYVKYIYGIDLTKHYIDAANTR